jgi:uncharacterized protein YaaQ
MLMETPPQTDTVLMLAIIQADDTDEAMRALDQAGVFAATLPSYGGFLGRKNATLFISATQARVPMALSALQHVCKQRTEYVPTHIEASSVPMPMPIAVIVGGATVFFISADYFEEY